MTSSEIRQKFLEFFKNRGHAILPSTSLVPENDPSVLFNTAGMQPLIPYLLGEEHPLGTRLASSQKCVRTQDIDEVGDNTHDTFFEMLGNWSLGDYWKKESIGWSYEFLTSLTDGLALNPERLFITCFAGDENAPQDLESAEIWRELFEKNNVKGERIYFMPAQNNWWSVGDHGPCGPDTEIFYDLTGELCNGMNHQEYLKADEEQRVVEVWNNVFMEYIKKDGKVTGKLEKKNIDTGSGFERLVMAAQGKTNIFDTDLFSDAMIHIRDHSKTGNIASERIVADHVRTAVFMIADSVKASNTERGYILRRLLRRAVRHADTLGLTQDTENGLGTLSQLASIYISKYGAVYPEVMLKSAEIYAEIDNEEKKFRKTLLEGMKQFEKISEKSGGEISGADAFTLFSTYGFPIELTNEMAKEKNVSVNEADFYKEFSAHQDLSRAGSGEKFKGGLGGTSEIEIKYHTTTHLLHQALRDVLGKGVMQKGSNITQERLRFDFSFDRKMTDEERKTVEDAINEKIQAKLPVQKVTLSKEEAEKTGALHFFADKYGDEVSIYFIGENIDDAYSKEFCGGPHVTNTYELGRFKIVKEEAVSAGVRRIKAVLE